MYPKGPWKTDQLVLNKQWIVTRRVRDFNDVVCRIDEPYNTRETADLIAAAPELFEALQEILRIERNPHSSADKINALIKAEDALANAKGYK